MFEVALPVILRAEGGFVDHPDDPGGATNRGITQSTYTNWLRTVGRESRSVKDITDEEVIDIYRSQYWEEAHCDDVPWPVSLAHFDAAVNHGVRQAIRFLQGVTGANVDGIWGPETQGAVARMDPDELLREALWARLKFYASITVRRPQFRTFLAGWLLRVIKLRQRCLSEIHAC